MQAFPHHYTVSASGQPESPVTLNADNLPVLVTAPPLAFGGPGDCWSPEDMLAGSVASCFILTFRAIARASKLEWVDISCTVVGRLDRIDRVTRFNHFTVTAKLLVPAGTDSEKASKLLEKAENSCLVTRSLAAETHLEASVTVQP